MKALFSVLVLAAMTQASAFAGCKYITSISDDSTNRIYAPASFQVTFADHTHLSYVTGNDKELAFAAYTTKSQFCYDETPLTERNHIRSKTFIQNPAN